MTEEILFQQLPRILYRGNQMDITFALAKKRQVLPGNYNMRNGEFRLTSRYNSDETLKAVVLLLQNRT